jgi:hypothetical protein
MQVIPTQHNNKIIAKFLLLLLFSQPSLSFSLLDSRLNWILASGLATSAVERGVFADLFGVCTDSRQASPYLSRSPELTDCNYLPSKEFCPDVV